jgi:hypothetical protein
VAALYLNKHFDALTPREKASVLELIAMQLLLDEYEAERTNALFGG